MVIKIEGSSVEKHSTESKILERADLARRPFKRNGMLTRGWLEAAQEGKVIPAIPSNDLEELAQGAVQYDRRKIVDCVTSLKPGQLAILPPRSKIKNDLSAGAGNPLVYPNHPDVDAPRPLHHPYLRRAMGLPDRALSQGLMKEIKWTPTRALWGWFQQARRYDYAKQTPGATWLVTGDNPDRHIISLDRVIGGMACKALSDLTQLALRSRGEESAGRLSSAKLDYLQQIIGLTDEFLANLPLDKKAVIENGLTGSKYLLQHYVVPGSKADYRFTLGQVPLSEEGYDYGRTWEAKSNCGCFDAQYRSDRFRRTNTRGRALLHCAHDEAARFEFSERFAVHRLNALHPGVSLTAQAISYNNRLRNQVLIYTGEQGGLKSMNSLDRDVAMMDYGLVRGPAALLAQDAATGPARLDAEVRGQILTMPE